MAYLALIDYGSGNLHSAERALRTAAGAAGIALDILVTDDAEKIEAADRIVLPGVGHFADCAKGLFGREGMVEAETSRTAAWVPWAMSTPRSSPARATKVS